MSSISKRIFEILGPFAFLTAFTSATLPQLAYATLGENQGSLSADMKALSSRPLTLMQEARASAGKRFRVLVFGDAGCTVKEFVTPAGVVFGLAWKGIRHPDFPQILGKYSAEFRDAYAQTQRPGHSPVAVHSRRAVVELGGQMRSVIGRAYVSARAPSNVALGEIHF
jgi:hypothetical protein